MYQDINLPNPWPRQRSSQPRVYNLQYITQGDGSDGYNIYFIISLWFSSQFLFFAVISTVMFHIQMDMIGNGEAQYQL